MVSMEIACLLPVDWKVFSTSFYLEIFYHFIFAPEY